MKKLRVIVGVVAALCAANGFCQPSTTAPLTIEEAISTALFPYASFGTLSADGTMLAIALKDGRNEGLAAGEAVSKSGVPASGNGFVGCDLWLVDLSTRKQVNLTAGTGSNWAPAWSPDSRRLAFYSDRDGESRLWVWNRASAAFAPVGNTAIHATRTPQPPVWTLDGKEVITKIRSESSQRIDSLPGPNEPGQVLSTDRVRVFVAKPVQPTRPSGELFLTDLGLAEIADLVAINVETGKIRRLTQQCAEVAFKISPDGTQLAICRVNGKEDKSLHYQYDLLTVDLSSGAFTVVRHGVEMSWIPRLSWSPDSGRIAYLQFSASGSVETCVSSTKDRSTVTWPIGSMGNLTGPLWDGTNRLYVFDAKKATRLDVVSGSIVSVDAPTGDDLCDVLATSDGNRVAVFPGMDDILVQTRDRRSLVEGVAAVSFIRKEAHNLFSRSLRIYRSYVSTAGIAAVADSPDFGPSVWAFGPREGRLDRLTDFNPTLSRKTLGKSIVIEWETSDGRTLKGAVLLPASFEAGKQFPVIVYVRPDARLSTEVNCFGLYGGALLNEQLFATRGYLVFSPDHTGGRGTPLIENLTVAVTSGLDKLKSLGWADDGRVGVVGASKGGYGALALVTGSKRFKAAVSICGWSDMFTNYGFLPPDGSARSVGILEELLPGGPWASRENYLASSPFFFLDRVEAPVLLIHGTEDTAVPVYCGEQTFVALRRLGKEAQLVEYLGEGHGIIRFENQVDCFNRMLAWFEKYIAEGRPTTP